MESETSVLKIQEAITNEIFFALGIARRGILRSMFGWLFYLPTRRFARIMFEADAAVEKAGAAGGCRRVLKELGVKTKVRGLENIPTEGPVIILANHPGVYDSMAFGSCMERRDFKAIVMETRFYHTLPNLHPDLIYVDADPSKNMPALREAIEHLNKGGIFLQFGSGLIEPDPSIRLIGDEVFAKWSTSLEIMMRKIPQTKIVPAIASGVLKERFASHPFTRLRKDEMDKRRLAEFMQVITQLIRPKSVNADPKISFGKAMTLESLKQQSVGKRLMDAIISNVRDTLTEHLSWVNSLNGESAG